MGNPFVHVELMSSNVTKSKEFYQRLFDWKMEDVPGMDYTLIKVGEGTGGGLMRHPVPGARSQWIAYVAVDDIEASAQKAKSLGGTILKPVTEIPGVGSFCVFSDPTGAELALWQPKEKM